MKAELEIKEFLKATNEFYTLCSQNPSDQPTFAAANRKRCRNFLRRD